MECTINSAAFFSSLVSTRCGVPVKDVRFNSVLKVWLGTVSGVPHAWSSDGRCIDRSRPELDLF
jgi:hypothetical protein